MMIIFKTNKRGTEKGFKANIHYTHVKPECQQIMYSSNGKIDMFTDQNDYSGSPKDCTWVITMPYHLYIKFQIQSILVSTTYYNHFYSLYL